MAFDPKKVGSALYPEAFGVLALIVAKLGAKYIDETYALTEVFRRSSDYVEAAALAIPGYLIATDKAAKEAKAVLYTNIGFMGQRLGDWAYGETIGKKAKVAKNRRLAGKPGDKGRDVLSEAEKILIAESRSRAVNNPAALARTGAPGYTEI